jgi:hypothetical protein
VLAKGHGEATVGQELREDTPREVTQGLEDLADLCAEILQARRGAGRILFDHLANCTKAEGQDDQLLLRTVVDVALDPASFGILRG